MSFRCRIKTKEDALNAGVPGGVERFKGVLSPSLQLT